MFRPVASGEKGVKDMNLVFAFLAGMFLTNGVPHLVSGIAGQKHMTLLAKDSTAIANVVWAFVNFVIGFWLVNLSGGKIGELILFNGFAISFLVGAIFMALADAWLFSNPNASFPWFKK